MKRAIAIVTLAAQSMGCATMFHGSTDQISIHSNEPDAKIYLDGNEIGTGNAVYAVPKKGNHIIRVSKQGCTDVITPIKYSFDGISLLGILIDLGLISMLIVDGAATGAISKADQTSYILTPSCQATPKSATTGAPAATR
jgi:hypothetical protein